jgi:hypothetical protein
VCWIHKRFIGHRTCRVSNLSCLSNVIVFWRVLALARRVFPAHNDCVNAEDPSSSGWRWYLTFLQLKRYHCMKCRASYSILEALHSRNFNTSIA